MPPIRGEDGFARFPQFADPLWCGDWEAAEIPQPDPIVIPPFVDPMIPAPKPIGEVAIYGCQISLTKDSMKDEPYEVVKAGVGTIWYGETKD